MSFITDFLRSVMQFIYLNISGGSFAVAIIIFTILVKLVILPLDIKSRQSMRRMSSVQPKLNEINEKYKNDAEKRNQKMQELYRKEKVNPMGGCLPLLIQFPVLIAMWTVIRTIANEQTVQMFLNIQNGMDYTQPGFLHSFLWVKNFWQPDSFTAGGTVIPLGTALAQIQTVANNPILTVENIANMQRNYMNVMQDVIPYFNNVSMNGWGVLPVIVFGSQFLMQRIMNKLNPQQAQGQAGQSANMMKTMNMIMPVMFLFICWGYSAAFSMYFAVSNIYGLVQNILLTIYFEKKDKNKNAKELTA